MRAVTKSFPKTSFSGYYGKSNFAKPSFRSLSMNSRMEPKIKNIVGGGALLIGLVAATTSLLFSGSSEDETNNSSNIMETEVPVKCRKFPVALAEEKIPSFGIPGTVHERTFIAIKPDGVHRNLVGKVIKMFESKGLKLVGIKLVHPTKDFAEKHYADLSKRPFFPGLVKYFSSGPVVAMVWEGPNAIKTGRKLVGATDPKDSEPGSFRGTYALQVGRNLIHGSDSPDAAQHEISLWFKAEEVVAWNSALSAWINEGN